VSWLHCDSNWDKLDFRNATLRLPWYKLESIIYFLYLVKEYAWGKRGGTSEVARLFAAGHKHFQIGQKTPYAEVLI
jgi:hypothetical protein